MITLYYVEKSYPYTVKVRVFFDHNLTELEAVIKTSEAVYTNNDKHYIVEYMANNYNVPVDRSVYDMYNYLLELHRSTLSTSAKDNPAQHRTGMDRNGQDLTGLGRIGVDWIALKMES